VLEGEGSIVVAMAARPLSSVLLVRVAVVAAVKNYELRVPCKIMWTAAANVMPVTCQNFGLSSHGLSMDIPYGTYGQEPKKFLIKKYCSLKSGYCWKNSNLLKKNRIPEFLAGFSSPASKKCEGCCNGGVESQNRKYHLDWRIVMKNKEQIAKIDLERNCSTVIMTKSELLLPFM
jgi:hypothetical protein